MSTDRPDQPKRHPRTGLLTQGPMNSIDDVIEYLAYRIGLIYYENAYAYGGYADGVNTLLQTYHEVWAEIVGRYDELRECCSRLWEEDECGANHFPGCYLHPDAPDEEVTEYVVQQWRKVSDRLGVPIRHEELQQEL